MSSHYVVYSQTPNSDGSHDIIRSGTCPDHMVAIQARAGQGVMKSDQPVDDTTHKVHIENGIKRLHQLVEKPEDQLIKSGINPALARRFAQKKKDKLERETKEASRAKLTKGISAEKLLAALEKQGIKIPREAITED